jgi:ubiquinone/menaquinone biosynthesis C-methylase UbiE
VKASSKEELQKAYDEWHASSGEVKEIKKQDLKHYLTMLNLLNPEPGKKLLDVGCGKGVFLFLASKMGLQTYGIDISKVAVDIARRVSHTSDIRVGLGEELPWDDNFFDYVTCLGSLEHFLDPAKGVKEMARVLKPDGRALILVPNSFFIGHIYMAWRYGIPPDSGGQIFSERFGTRKEWQELIEGNGLKVEKVKAYNGYFSSPKVSFWVNLAYRALRPLIPFNLSADFIFICSKGGKS